jgi:hypothetical protein
LSEVEVLKAKLELDSNFPLTNNQKNLMQRAKTYQEQKLNFEKNNLNLDKDEFLIFRFCY